MDRRESRTGDLESSSLRAKELGKEFGRRVGLECLVLGDRCDRCFVPESALRQGVVAVYL